MADTKKTTPAAGGLSGAVTVTADNTTIPTTAKNVKAETPNEMRARLYPGMTYAQTTDLGIKYTKEMWAVLDRGITHEPTVSRVEYEHLKSRPFSELSATEFKKLAAGVRGETKAIMFFLPEHLSEKNNAYFEHCFLSAILAGADAGPITAEMFVIPKRRFIFAAMLELKKIKALSVETLITLLRKSGNLERCGGETYIREISELTLTRYNAAFYAEQILRFYLARMAAG
jgi:hypothetical protein